MSLENLALFETGDLPIKRNGDPVYNGKVRSVYWLNSKDSKRLIEERQYKVRKDTTLGVMVISDRISAFECNWQSENGLKGVPGKGASLNAMSEYWFKKFAEQRIGYQDHFLEAPHPLVWIVEKARPILIEAISRQYITGSLWVAYKKGERNFCGIELRDGLKEHQRLDELLITPTTKGIMRGIPGVKEEDDTNLTRQQIFQNFNEFGFLSEEDIKVYERLLTEATNLVSSDLESKGIILADTKFEFGYFVDVNRKIRLGFIDEVGTLDSSRMWDAEQYAKGVVVENSKEGFRQFLKKNTDRAILEDKKRMEERRNLAASYRVPVEQFMEVSRIYKEMAEKITGREIKEIENPREEILDVLNNLGLLIKCL